MLSATAPRGKKVVAFRSQEAAEQGVAPGMPLAEAKALAGPAPTFFELYDPRADRAALRQLALDCQRFGPYAALEEAEPPECVVVDITGCAPIFHGETALAEEASRMLRERGFTARIAIADTIGAAWALAASGAASARRDETGVGCG
ncbi:MAG: hypothetical protein L0Y71_26030, partial [Gemmataceae bacterium]|nr:hypothetical protein [Gemmataceae bacterium]